MRISPPVCITPRLMVGVVFHECGTFSYVSIEYSNRPGCDGRTRYRYFIVSGDNEYTADDLQSGVGGGSLQSGLESLLSFLSHYGESYAYHQRTNRKWDDKPELPNWLLEWCYLHSDELTTKQLELSETPNLIVELK